MEWSRIFEKYGQVWNDSGSEPDPFSHLSRGSTVPPESQVEMQVSRSADLGNGWVKCQATVRVTCPQDEKSINMAGEVAFLKALEGVNDGMSFLAPGLPPIEPA